MRERAAAAGMSTTKLTYEDYLRIPDDGLRHEILDGEHVVSPSAGTPHQDMQLRLGAELLGLVDKPGLGHVFTGLDCVLGTNDVVRPDILVVLAAHGDRLLRTHIAGWPDLIVEILSPSSQLRDREQKRRRYEACGVPEYWIADTDARTIDQYGLYDGSYRHLGTARDSIRLAILPEITVDLRGLWPAPLS